MKNMTFSRYAPFIREYIYRKGWTDLREVQIKACEAILDTDKHVIIASGTASGKTEAAFFPVLTVLENEVSNSIGVLYIGPLKALINDQFQRLNELLRDCDINVWPWHGDIVGSKKERAIRDASGVMQITPESLESLLMRRTNDVKKLFNDLKFVVIDEIHVFMGEDRGLQLLCLLKRLEQIANCSPRRIGLSATLHDYESAKAFLSAGTEREVIAVGVEGCNRRAIIGVECYKFPEDIGERDQTLNLYNQFLYTQCYDKKCLTFTNSRSEAEMFVYDMKNIAQTRKEPDVFYAHHGSVTSLLRERAEQKMKSASGPIVTAATKTLELGVDIGDLDLIIQLGAPNTCSSFVQRLGRSGRRSGRSKMLFVESFSEHCDKPLECIPWELLQTIAIIQLYREEKWIEPFEVKEKPYSLLVHQTLALLMQNGATKPSNLGRMVLSLPPFQNKITVREYGKILKYMLKINMLEKLDDGYLIIGNAGEQVCNHYSFYAIFPDKEEYRVISKDGLIGSIDEVPNVGENFALAGEIWRVIEINCFKKTISVVAGTGRGMGYWKGGGGRVSDKIVYKMKNILEEKTEYSYLSENTSVVLRQARELARDLGIMENNVHCHNKEIIICPWVGSKTLMTMTQLLNCGLKEKLSISDAVDKGNYISLTSCLSVDEFIEKSRGICLPSDDPKFVLRKYFRKNGDNENIGAWMVPYIDKLDYSVPPELLEVAYLENEMDILAAEKVFKSLTYR